MDKLSIIIPCYNEEESIQLYYDAMQALKQNFKRRVKWEYLFINDGSTDRTLTELRRLAAQSDEVRYLSFSRNFGKEAGLYAGLEHATGDYVAVMDVDLQDPPEMLIDMYEILKTTDYDCVGTQRTTRKGESVIRSWFAENFYRLINKISNTHIVDGARDYRLMTRQMVDAILQVSEYNRFSKGIFSWVGFKTKYLPYENHKRQAGETSWNFWSLFLYSIDGIMSYSQFPLDLVSILGVVVFLLAVIFALFFMIRTLFFGNPTSGWTSTIVIILGLGGIQLLSLGIVGKYVGKAYLEVKKRPIYILKETEEDLKHKE
ncbi:MAG: glycosyltransferase family 2 protein [Aerococcus sp.]|nr:glycosyltransferase family 2 protein [Aerococcus sp.]